MNKTKGPSARRLAVIGLLAFALLAVSLTTAGCNDQMARLQESQTKLEAMTAANSRQLATISTQVHSGQGHLSETLAIFKQDQQRMAAEVVAVRQENSQLRQAIVDGNRQLAKELTKVVENQALLREGVTQIAQMVQTTNTSVSAVAREHATLHRMVQQNKTELAEALATVSRQQERTHAGIAQLQQADQGLADAIAAVSTRQEAARQLSRDNHERLMGHLTTLASGQGQLDEDLGALTGLAQTVAADVATVARGQTAIQGALDNHAATLADKIAVVQRNQQDIQSVIDQVANAAGTAADGVNTLAAGQEAIGQQQQANHAGVTERLAALAQDQQNLQVGLDGVEVKANEAATRLSDLVAGQDAIERTLAHSSETLAVAARQREQLERGLGSLDARADALAASTAQVTRHIVTLGDKHSALQQTMESGMAGLAEEAARTAEAQWSLRDALWAHGEEVGSRAAAFARTQEQLQSGLDTVTATTGQVGLDVIALDTGQTKLQSQLAGIQADRDTFAGWLDEIAQAQQQWLTRFDATQADMKTVTASLGALEQRVTELRSTLQDKLETVTGSLDDRTQQRTRFERTLGQNMEALAEWVTQLRAMQGTLQQQMQQVQNSTQGQGREILAALEQLQRKTETRSLEATAEPASPQAAAPQEVLLP